MHKELRESKIKQPFQNDYNKYNSDVRMWKWNEENIGDNMSNDKNSFRIRNDKNE